MTNYVSYRLIYKAYFSFFLTVTRSRLRMMIDNGVRDCFVAISPRLADICHMWLRRVRRMQVVQAAQAAQAAHTVPPIRQRSASVASARNLFSVNNQIREFGSDFLPNVNTVNTEEPVEDDRTDDHDTERMNLSTAPTLPSRNDIREDETVETVENPKVREVGQRMENARSNDTDDTEQIRVEPPINNDAGIILFNLKRIISFLLFNQ